MTKRWNEGLTRIGGSMKFVDKRMECHSSCKNNASRRPPYVSCITINGRPILPPVMTAQVYAEMLRFKELALAVEKKLQQQKEDRVSARSCCPDLKLRSTSKVVEDSESFHSHIKRAEVIESVKSEDIIDEFGSKCTHDLNHLTTHDEKLLYSGPIADSPDFHVLSRDASTPPSIASTDLAKYMTATSDRDDRWSYDLNCGVLSNVDPDNSGSSHLEEPVSPSFDDRALSVISAASTVVPDKEDTKSGMPSKESQSQSYKSHVRKHSYTLEVPSPMLIAHLQRIHLEHYNNQSEEQRSSVLHRSADDNDDYYISDNTPSHEIEMVNVRELNYLNQMEMHPHTDSTENETEFQGQEMLDKRKSGVQETLSQAKLVVLGFSSTSNHPSSHARNLLHQDSKLLELTPSMKTKFDLLSAAVKGYLTRRLMRTQKVQLIITTIKDTLEFALQLHTESPLKNNRITPQDVELRQRLLLQLTNACCEFHDIFFELSTKERMNIISQDRQLLNQKSAKACHSSQKRNLSSATIKAIERKRHRSSGSVQSSVLSPTVFKRRCSKQKKKVHRDYSRLLGFSGNTIRPQTASPLLQHAWERQSQDMKRLRIQTLSNSTSPSENELTKVMRKSLSNVKKVEIMKKP